VEIATAAKSVEPNPLYYSFSDIGSKQLAEISTGSTTELNGSERFILKPEAMIAEILAVKKARKQYNTKNIKLIIPRLRSVRELLDIKKILSSQGIRRSSILELFAEVAVGSLVFDLPEIRPTDLDGILIDIIELGKSIFDRSDIISRDNQVLINALKVIIDNKSTHKTKRILRAPSDPELVGRIVQMGVAGLIFDSIPDDNVFKEIKKAEKHLIVVKPKRGRKPKSL